MRLRLRGGRPKRFQMGGGAGGTAFNPVGMTRDQLQQAAQQFAAANPGGPTAAQNLGMMGLGINPATGFNAPANPAGSAAFLNSPFAQNQMQGMGPVQGAAPGAGMGSMSSGAGGGPAWGTMGTPGAAPPVDPQAVAASMATLRNNPAAMSLFGPSGRGNLQPQPGGGWGTPGAAPAGASMQNAAMAAANTPQANPLAQQLAARGAMPGGMRGGMMPGGGGMPGGMGNFQPRPGMGWGAAPGAGPMGVPPGGATGMAGAGAPGMGGGMGPQQQAMLGALAARGTGFPGAMQGGGAGSFLDPVARAQAGLPPLPTPTPVGMARGGKVVPPKGTTGPIKRGKEVSFDSTKPVAGNLPIRSGKGKEPLAKARGGGIGGRILSHSETAGDAPDRPVQRSANSTAPNVGTTGPIKRGPINSFDSTRSVGDNLPIRSGKGKEPLAKARGGAVRRREARNREDRRSPSPQPYYDTAPAGDDGWPPTPTFTSAPAANVPPPTPNPTPQALAPGMAKGGKWISGAIKHPGALHKQLGVPEGEKIPAKKLAKAAEAGGKLGQRARLAETLKGFRKARGGECVEDKDKDRMAMGGAAKERKGYPNTIRPPKRMAAGGEMRGAGIAERGKRFSGIY